MVGCLAGVVRLQETTRTTRTRTLHGGFMLHTAFQENISVGIIGEVELLHRQADRQRDRRMGVGMKRVS